MKVTNETIYKLPEKEQDLVKALLIDIKEINDIKVKPEIYLDWIDQHTEWSPERTDPCPDYYGYYTLRSKITKEMIGIEMTIEDLDMVLCALYNYIFDCE